MIRCGKCCFCYWITPHAKVVALGLVSLQCNDNITQTLTITKLSEHECHELIPASEVLDIAITSILANKIIEVISIEKRCQLCENEFILEHMQSLILTAKLPIQVR